MKQVYIDPQDEGRFSDGAVRLCIKEYKYRLIYQQRDNFVVIGRTEDCVQIRWHVSEIMHRRDIIEELPPYDAYVLGNIAGSEFYHPTDPRLINETPKRRKKRRNDYIEDWENIPHLGIPIPRRHDEPE